jgi:hypothetical protein
MERINRSLTLCQGNRQIFLKIMRPFINIMNNKYLTDNFKIFNLTNRKYHFVGTVHE